MQVERDVLEQPAELADLLKAPLEKALIVGLEAQIALLPQDLIIDLQIRAPGQTALALAVGRPRIGEVQVDAVDLGRSEYLAQLGRVEGDVLYLSLLYNLRTEISTLFYLAYRLVSHAGT